MARGNHDVTAEELRSMYHDQGMTQEQIAGELGVTQQSVHHLMKSRGVETRGSAKSRCRPATRKNVASAVRIRTADRPREEWRGEARAGGCDSCEADEAEAHHVVPVMLGGVTAPELVAGLCPSCHAKADAALREALDFVPGLLELGDRPRRETAAAEEGAA